MSLNQAEGDTRTAGDQRRMSETALGSAGEVRAAIQIGVAWGSIAEPPAILATLDRLMALAWRLPHPRVAG